MIRFYLVGILFGTALFKGEVISWQRVNDMFYFRDPHMFLVIASAVATGVVSMFLLKKFFWRTLGGAPLSISENKPHWGNAIGGFIFGVGWFITGTCPGPIFTQIGAGSFWAIYTLVGALLGTLVYSILRPRLPH
jgi:uncharacterized protein